MYFRVQPYNCQMDNQMRDEDIFYSDDEFSDSEDFYQVGS